jgi:hypothetical protein
MGNFAMKRAFTITELLVAMGLLAAILAGSGVVFSSAVKAKRTAEATAEITQKLQTITDQLTADFEGLRKDGEILLIWMAGTDDDGDGTVDRYERFDRIMFFANGDFYSYHLGPNGDIIHGNIARICYMLAKNGDRDSAQIQEPAERILSRTQHIYSSEAFPVFPEMTPFVEADFRADNYSLEYETTILDDWKWLPFAEKDSVLTIISDVRIGGSSAIPTEDWGTTVDPADPCTIHTLFCEGVGEFSIQGWHEGLGRWVPQVDPDNDGDMADTDFIPNGSGIDAANLPGILYPYLIGAPLGSRGVEVYLNGLPTGYPESEVDEAHFNQIPGFGKAFKFTFTIYDSIGIFPKGKTFTHIVYLND